MKTVTIPANAAREERDKIIARMIRHIARVQRTVQHIQAADDQAGKLREQP